MSSPLSCENEWYGLRSNTGPDKGAANSEIFEHFATCITAIKIPLHMAVTRDQVELCKFITDSAKNVPA